MSRWCALCCLRCSPRWIDAARKNHFQHEDRRASCDTCVVVLFVKHMTGRLAKTKTLFNTTADMQRVLRAWRILLRTQQKFTLKTNILGRYDNCRTTSFANVRWMCGSLRLLALFVYWVCLATKKMGRNMASSSLTRHIQETRFSLLSRSIM